MTGSCPVSAHVCQQTARERDELRDALGILVKRQTDDQLKIERLTREREHLLSMLNSTKGETNG